MDEIFTKEDIERTKAALRNIEKILDEKDLDTPLERMGKNANVLLPMNPGMGKSIFDLSKKELNLLINIEIAMGNLEDAICGGQ